MNASQSREAGSEFFAPQLFARLLAVPDSDHWQAAVRMALQDLGSMELELLEEAIEDELLERERMDRASTRKDGRR